MNKQQLQTILSSPYDQDNWKKVLIEVFGVKNISQQAANVALSDNDLAINAFELANFTTTDERIVGIFEVNLQPKVKIEANKVGIKRILESIYKYDVDAALIVFVANDKKQWRFSFVSDIKVFNEQTQEIERKTTEEQKSRKRYTYLLGQNETCRTATEQFLFLKDKPFTLNDLYEAFNVDKLNKAFFSGYQAHYKKFWEYLNGQAEYRNLLIDSEQSIKEKQEKPIRDFAKKLLGRIVFLYFLQKKGWMGVPASRSDWKEGDPNFVKNFFLNATDKTKFYSQNLIHLFFHALNVNRADNNDVFSLTGTKIPYLNGGLFENDAKQTNHFDFPESYFAELFEFFDQYNFTIDENSPDDANVGIDPEMLGHIFENLLEENKDKGAFYTPKEIVQYMCQEALIQYLKPHFASEAAIEGFIRDKNISSFLRSRDNALKLDKLLDKVKICDPAIGSGAFPIGILQEIFEAKRFIFPFTGNNSFEAANIKLGIIEHTIHGVDMDKGAVDIARLRFWLALVVDEETPRPLPNLDFKIMQGDSLFDTFEGVDLSKIGTDDDDEVVLEEKTQLDIFGGAKQSLLVFDKAAREDLTQLIDDYFDPKKDSTSKATIRRKIDEKINKKIHTRFEREKLDLKVKIEKQEKLWKDGGVWGRLNETSKDYKRYKSLLELYESFDQREQRVQELQKKPNEKPYFLWQLFFKKVFQKGGFDIVIGNPPYFSVSKQPQLKALAERYDTYESTGDIYSLFYERGHQLLRSGGVLVYITGSSWLRSNYGTSLRKFFREKTDPIKLIDLSDCQIFESATVLTTIMSYRKTKNTNALRALRLTRRTQYAVKHLNHYFESNHIELKTQTDDTAWVILDRTRYDLKQKIELQGTKLKEWNIRINRGIVTGFNQAFELKDQSEKEIIISDDIKSKELIKPLLQGRNIEKFTNTYEGKYIIFTRRGINIEEYQGIKKHLYKYYEDLKPKNNGDSKGRKAGTYKWYEIQDNTAYFEDFEKPKIIYPEITKFINFTYDDKGFYTEAV